MKISVKQLVSLIREAVRESQRDHRRPRLVKESMLDPTTPKELVTSIYQLRAEYQEPIKAHLTARNYEAAASQLKDILGSSSLDVDSLTKFFERYAGDVLDAIERKRAMRGGL